MYSDLTETKKFGIDIWTIGHLREVVICELWSHQELGWTLVLHTVILQIMFTANYT